MQIVATKQEHKIATIFHPYTYCAEGVLENTGNEIVHIDPVCSATSNKTSLVKGANNNAITHVNCSCQIESCSKSDDQDVGWTDLNYVVTGVGVLCFLVILAIVAWAVVYKKKKNNTAQKKETIDDNPEYGSEDSDQDEKTNVMDRNDYYEM